jgi:hypothetical protein
MNIDRIHSESLGDAGQLEGLYGSVPCWQELLAAVRAGRDEFNDLLLKAGLLEEHGALTSNVHGCQAVEVHGFILGIPSAPRWDEVQTKSFLTYASHWIDDFFDSRARVVNPARLMADRGDIQQALSNMGAIGQVGFAMADRVRHPVAVYKALHRMLYGGLVQRAADYSQRRALVGEYVQVATRFVDEPLVAEIKRLQPEAYWATNKTVLELLDAAQSELDFNRSELWNLIYAPALYYEDSEEERARGELSFEEADEPRPAEMLRMIRLGARHLARSSEPDHPRLRQLEFAARALPNLPDPVAAAYRSIWMQPARLPHPRRPRLSEAGTGS